MLDAYDLQQMMLNGWRQLAFTNNAGSLQKQFADVPVYVNVNGELKPVTGMYINDKIVLEI